MSAGLIDSDTTPRERRAALVRRMPARVNLAIWRGDDCGFTLVITTSDGQPLDLTGAAVAAQVRTITAPRVIAGQFTATVTGNQIQLQLPAAITGNLPAGAEWDCQVTLDDWITTLTAGTVTVRGDVTR